MLGLPLYGLIEPSLASVGAFSANVFSAGIFSVGVFSVGIFSVGIVSIGPFSLALYAAIGIYAQSMMHRKSLTDKTS